MTAITYPTVPLHPAYKKLMIHVQQTMYMHSLEGLQKLMKFNLITHSTITVIVQDSSIQT